MGVWKGRGLVDRKWGVERGVIEGRKRRDVQID